MRHRLAVVTILALGILILGGSWCYCGEPKPAAPEMDAKCVRLKAPEKLLTDQPFRASMTMKNTGTATWSERPHGVKLVAVAPAGNTTWGTNFIILGQGRKIEPGAEHTFGSWLKAPSEPGTYVFQWQVCRTGRGGAVFGEATEAKTIVVEQGPEEEPPPPVKQPETGPRILTFEDFEYAGSFKLPRRSPAGGDPLFASSGLALRTMKDGSKRLFIIYFRGGLFEVEIPALVKLKGGNHKPLKVAAVKTVWGKLGTGGVGLNAGFYWDEAKKTLYWSTYHSYWTGGAKRPILGASRLGEDGKVTHLGPWRLANGMFKGYWGGVTRLSKAFANQYTGGRTLALGFGGYYSVCGGTSQGPSLGAIAEPDPKKQTLDLVPLLGTSWGSGHPAPRDGDYLMVASGWGGKPPASRARGTWTMEDWVRSGVFIDLPEKRGYVAFVSLGTGRIGYDYGKITCAGRTEWWYFYDLAELGKVAKGEKKQWAVLPHTRTKVEHPLASKGARRTSESAIPGAYFDEADRLLYLFKPRWIDNRWPCVHVYRVK